VAQATTVASEAAAKPMVAAMILPQLDLLRCGVSAPTYLFGRNVTSVNASAHGH
jgi:hypothetical protein